MLNKTKDMQPKESLKDKVLKYLKYINIGKTPTEIGLALGKDYNSVSSSVSSPLKKLVEEGIIYKMKIDGKVLYGYKNKLCKLKV